MLFNTPYFRVLNANTSSAPISIYTGNFLIQNREYGFNPFTSQFLNQILSLLYLENNHSGKRHVKSIFYKRKKQFPLLNGLILVIFSKFIAPAKRTQRNLEMILNVLILMRNFMKFGLYAGNAFNI